jgi:tetratricopeptide (TPR) repeat protein
MGRSMSLPAVPEQLARAAHSPPIYSEQLNRHFEVSQQGSELYQTEYEVDGGGHEVFRTTHKLDYVIGSGTNGYTYLVRRGDYLFQAPLSYYVQKRAWDLSPGYEVADNGFNRPIAAACIACHSGRPQSVRDRTGLFCDPPFLELAIGCENCHGPGALHAAEMAQGRRRRVTADLGIVNPARLPASLAEDICMNCHQGGDTRILWPGKNYSDFRPGTPLSQTLAILRIPRERSTAGDADLLEHHFSMHVSRCYRASGGRLSCFTCHQVHAMLRPFEASAYYRARCLTCHLETSCKLPKPQRARQADDCVNCHMPKRQVEIVAHSALTNHRIPARPSEPLPDAAFAPSTPGTPDLIFWNAPADSKAQVLPPIMLLQAYGELMEKEPRYQTRYFALLDALAKSDPGEPLVQASLGSKMLRSESGSYNSAIEHLTQAINLGFSAPSVYADLAEALARTNREEEAAQTLERGIRVSPFVPVLYKSLSLRLINLKRYADARKTMEQYMELFPEDDFMRGLLRKVGDTTSSSRK